MGVDLSIIIVNWNGRAFLPDCLRSIVENPPRCSYEIVVVDNASSDGSVEWVRSDEGAGIINGANFRLIESGDNLGFGRANNLAFEQTDSKYLFVLNPDSIVPAGSIDKLIETLEVDEEIGITAPRLVNEDGVLGASVIPFRPTPLSIVVEEFQLYRLLPRRLTRYWLFGRHWDYDVRRPVPLVAGAAMMCKRAMIDQVGGFNKDIFMYGEDLEWCVSVYRGGWKIYFEPDAEIIHRCGKSSEQMWSQDEVMVIQEEAIVQFHRKCFSRTLNFMNSATKVLVMSVHFIRWKIFNRKTDFLRNLIKVHTRNCRELITGRGDRTMAGN